MKILLRHSVENIWFVLKVTWIRMISGTFKHFPLLFFCEFFFYTFPFCLFLSFFLFNNDLADLLGCAYFLRMKPLPKFWPSLNFRRRWATGSFDVPGRRMGKQVSFWEPLELNERLGQTRSEEASHSFLSPLFNQLWSTWGQDSESCNEGCDGWSQLLTWLDCEILRRSMEHSSGCFQRQLSQ